MTATLRATGESMYTNAHSHSLVNHRRPHSSFSTVHLNPVCWPATSRQLPALSVSCLIPLHLSCHFLHSSYPVHGHPRASRWTRTPTAFCFLRHTILERSLQTNSTSGQKKVLLNTLLIKSKRVQGRKEDQGIHVINVPLRAPAYSFSSYST